MPTLHPSCQSNITDEPFTNCMRQYECSLSEIFAEQQKTFEKPSDCPTGIKQQMQQLEQLFIALCHAVPLWATLSINCQTLASLPCIIHCCLIQF